MVKGRSRRVVVIRTPGKKLFEEAIFILKEDAKTPQDAKLVMEQASRAAGDYLKKCGVPPVKKRRHTGVIAAVVCMVVLSLALAAGWYFFL